MKELSLTTDLMFNRILAKNNFKYEDEETALYHQEMARY